MRHKKQRGVTLIEMVMVVAILGIVASIAYPSYQERSRRAKRTDAKAALINLAAAQERFFLRNNRYAANIGELEITGTENGFYNLTVSSDGASEFEGKAKPSGPTDQGQWLDDQCVEFVINQLGRKTAQDSDGADNSAVCWQK